jgi:hypothetical protein
MLHAWQKNTTTTSRTSSACATDGCLEKRGATTLGAAAEAASPLGATECHRGHGMEGRGKKGGATEEAKGERDNNTKTRRIGGAGEEMSE